MALRQIRKVEDEILRKNCRKVDKIDKRITVLRDDMVETMHHENGIGLAAPQVGVLKRIVVVDIGEGPVKLVNPEIIIADGSQIGIEGCLSIPGTSGDVERPQRIEVKALNEEGSEIKITANDLFARAICHEIDHLNGVLFIDKIIIDEVTK